MPHIQYFDRSGRVLSKREAFEADGKTIRDGVRCRVPAHLADSRMRFTDARSFWDAHRASLTDGRSGRVEGNRPGFRMFTDDDAGRQAVADARASYISDLENAWRNPPPRDAGLDKPPVTGRTRCPECDGSGVVHGKVCQGCGGDGWVDDKDDDDNGETATSDHRSVDQMAHDHSIVMERLYAARNREISEAWRKQ